MSSDGLRWTQIGSDGLRWAPHRMVGGSPLWSMSDISGRLDSAFALPTFLQPLPAMRLQIHTVWAPRGQIGELIFAPRVSG